MRKESIHMLTILLVAIIACMGWMYHLMKKKKKDRLSKYADRRTVSVDQLANEIYGGVEGLSEESVLNALQAIAKKLGIPAGLLRADDLISDLAGQDFFAGDALLDIEHKLSREATLPSELTVKNVVMILAKQKVL